MADTRKISEIAREIEDVWSQQGKGVNYAAKPYLDAMMFLDRVTDRYYADSAEYIVRYFLNNATSFRGEDAKRLKAELKALL
jgi:hypothetical protein